MTKLSLRGGAHRLLSLVLLLASLQVVSACSGQKPLSAEEFERLCATEEGYDANCKGKKAKLEGELEGTRHQWMLNTGRVSINIELPEDSDVAAFQRVEVEGRFERGGMLEREEIRPARLTRIITSKAEALAKAEKLRLDELCEDATPPTASRRICERAADRARYVDGANYMNQMLAYGSCMTTRNAAYQQCRARVSGGGGGEAMSAPIIAPEVQTPERPDAPAQEQDAASSPGRPETRPLPEASEASIPLASETPPQWLRRPDPEMPQRATRAGVSGQAELDCIVSTTGRVTDCTVLSETPEGYGFGAAALRAARRATLRPARQGGRAVESSVRYRVGFRALPADPDVRQRDAREGADPNAQPLFY